MVGIKTYRRFLMNFEVAKKNANNQISDEEAIALKKTKSNYKDMSVEDIKIYEMKKAFDDTMRVEQALKIAQYFTMNDDLKYLLEETDVPKSKELLKFAKLPFKSIYLDLEFSPDKDDFIFDEKDDRKIVGLLITETFNSIPRIDYDNKKIFSDYNHFFDIFAIIEGVITDDKGNIIGQRGYLARTMIPICLADGFYMQNESYRNIENFYRKIVINFLLFLNQERDVEYIDVQSSSKNKTRKISGARQSFPNYRIVRVMGKLLEYVNKRKSENSGSYYNYQFRVRGFWRHLRSSKFKQSRGKIIWIDSFVKGKGLLVEPTYLVK